MFKLPLFPVLKNQHQIHDTINLVISPQNSYVVILPPTYPAPESVTEK